MTTEKRVDTETKTPAESALQSYFSASIDVIVAAGVEAQITVTEVTISLSYIPKITNTFKIMRIISGKTIKRRRRAKGKYLFKAPLTSISASLIPTKSIDIGATASPKEDTKSTIIRGIKSDRENIKIIIPIYVGIVDGLKKIFFKEIKTLFPVYINRPADQEKKENPIT